MLLKRINKIPCCGFDSVHLGELMDNLIFDNVIQILNEVRETSSLKEKARILTNNKSAIYLREIFKYAYNNVDYTYGVSADSIENFSCDSNDIFDMSMFAVLDSLNDRIVTGKQALELCKRYIYSNPKYEELFLNIIDKDLRIGVNTKTINKIWEGLVPKPNYNRCQIFDKKRAGKLTFPAFLQLKCDGTYREAHVQNGKVTFKTRAGEPYENRVLAYELRDFPNGYYLGELTIGRADEPDVNRSIGNGLINSTNPPYDDIHFTIWDYLTDSEYQGLDKTPYFSRFSILSSIIRNYGEDSLIVQLVPNAIVSDLETVFKITSHVMDVGLEGTVLKDFKMLFTNGTNSKQLKIKLKVDCEMRITGFTLGNGKRKDKVGAIVFENDQRTIKGSCSGFSNKEMEQFTKDPNKYIGKIISVEFTDISKSPNNDYFALVHPRYIEIRKDKTETDTLAKVKNLIQMAKELH